MHANHLLQNITQYFIQRLVLFKIPKVAYCIFTIRITMCKMCKHGLPHVPTIIYKLYVIVPRSQHLPILNRIIMRRYTVTYFADDVWYGTREPIGM